MTILTRYVLREHVGPLLFALAALTSLLLLNQVAKQFGNLVGKGLPWSVIGEFFALSVPFVVAMTMPMAILVAVLYAFSRLTAENEVTALRASGVGVMRLIWPVLWGGAAIGLLMFGFNDQILPRANLRLGALQADIARTKPTFALREQVINEVSPGQLFLRANHIEQAANRLREVTIYDLSDPLRRRTVYADSGFIGMTPNRQDLQMTLFDGTSLVVPRNDPSQLQRLSFAWDLVRVRGVGSRFERSEQGFKGDREVTICEAYDIARRSARDLARARAALSTALRNAAWQAATGTARPAADSVAPRVRRPLGLATLYCEGVLPLVGVRTAQAEVLPGVLAAAPGQGAPPQDIRRTGDALDRAQAVVRAADSAARADTSIPENIRIIPSVPSEAQALAIGAGRAAARTGARIGMLQAQATEARQRVNQYAVEIEKKIAISAACVVFVLLGAPIALRFPRGGVGLVIGVSLGAFSLYYVGLIAGETLADRLILPPFLAMWLANILFTTVGLILLRSARRRSATARGGELGELLDRMRLWRARQEARLAALIGQRRRA